MGKTFTVPEAQTLLPVLESLMARAQNAGLRAAERETEIEALRQRIFVAGGLHVDVVSVARWRAERDKAVQEAKDTLAEIEQIGVIVHDLETGLLDFPCLVDGDVLMLCWRPGETTIGYWHEAEAAAEARRPLDGRFGRGDRERLN